MVSKDYINSFMHIALTWDPRHTSPNLIINDQFNPQVITCKNSKETFKSAFTNEVLEPGDRYFFQIKMLQGCNFKIGISKTKMNQEIAFCDSTNGFGYYSAGQLRNGSKTSG